MAKLIATAAVLQIAEARRLAPKLAEAIGGEPDESGHPANGFREEPDELARVDENLIMPLGTQPCRWPEEEFDEAVGGYMQSLPRFSPTAAAKGSPSSSPSAITRRSAGSSGTNRTPTTVPACFYASRFPSAISEIPMGHALPST